MKELRVLEFLEKNKEYFFPNEKYSEREIEEAMINTSSLFEQKLGGIPFKSPAKAKKIAKSPLGILGGDRFYLGDNKGGVKKYFSFGIGRKKDIETAGDRCRALNCELLLEAAKNFPKGKVGEDDDYESTVNDLIEELALDIESDLSIDE